DSAYAVADISPKQLKADLISIATVGALADVPEDTANILAWNGGGQTNYTKIIKSGAYEVKGFAAQAENYVHEKAADLKAKLKEISLELEELIEKA
ncbi:MAG: serine protease, partial [Watsoniomyces obsoletus]